MFSGVIYYIYVYIIAILYATLYSRVSGSFHEKSTNCKYWKQRVKKQFRPRKFTLRWAGHLARIGGTRCACLILVGEPLWKRIFRKQRRDSKDNTDRLWIFVKWICGCLLVQDRVFVRCICGVETSGTNTCDLSYYGEGTFH